MKSKYVRLLCNIGIFTLANFASRILHFLILPLYTFYLTTEEYGIIDLMSTTISLIFPIVSLTICDAVIRFAISEKDEKENVFSVGFNVISIGGLFVLAFSIVIYILTDRAIIAMFFFIIYMLQSYNTLLGSYTKAIGKTKLMAIITTTMSLLTLLINVLFIADLKYGILGYWLSMAISNVIGLFSYIILSKIPKDAYYIDFTKLKENSLFHSMIKYSLPLIPNALFWWINSSLDRWTLTFMTSLSVVGLYSVASKIPTIVSTFNSIFSQAWNLSLFQDGTDDNNEFYKSTQHFFNECLFCVVIVLISMTPLLARFLFSKDFYSAWIYVPILTMGVFYNAQNTFMGSLFTAKKQTKDIFTTTAVGAVVNIVLNIILIYFLGAIGAAISTLVSYIAVFLSRLVRIKKLYSIDPEICKQLFYFMSLCAQCVMVMTSNRILRILSICLAASYSILFSGKFFLDRKYKIK